MSIFCHDNITHNIALILIILWRVARQKGLVMMLENQEIIISPLSLRCETEFKFNISGTITGLTDDAKQTIDVLKLGDSLQQNQKLVDIRKQAIANFLFSQSTTIDDLIEDDELLTLLVEDLQQKTEGKLQPFAPIITKALKNWIDGNK